MALLPLVMACYCAVAAIAIAGADLGILVGGLTLFATPIIYLSIFQNEVVGVLYIDFCKAFDMVNHNLLLQKLKIYNVQEDAIAWFTSYLSDRKQCIKINKSMSDQQPVSIGVPQGSILGPPIFLLSVNDLPLQDSLEGLNLFCR